MRTPEFVNRKEEHQVSEEKGRCGRPEWADDDCPMDNPNEEITDCCECRWYREEQE